MLTLRRCSSAEEKLNIPEGTLKRIVKTQEQKEKDLEAVMHSENLPVINGINYNSIAVFNRILLIDLLLLLLLFLLLMLKIKIK